MMMQSLYLQFDENKMIYKKIDVDGASQNEKIKREFYIQLCNSRDSFMFYISMNISL